MWEAMQRLYPAEPIATLSPRAFFSAEANGSVRITLQRSKEYEEHLKQGLKALAVAYPTETRQLLDEFRLSADTDKEVDLCDLLFQLKGAEMLPCLVFNLNTFEAMRIFKHVVAGVEWRQKQAHPNYYSELKAAAAHKVSFAKSTVKATGGNRKALEDLQKDGESDAQPEGDVDTFKPHPNFRFGKSLIHDELMELCAEMEEFDGFEKKDKHPMRRCKGPSLAILQHALMRGLRRGIGLFTKETVFPAYRRAVQRLASQGKLSVVIADGALAFGVNMPFRTCVFAGEMGGKLDVLMAQQMAGRAGRRGLDTQGHLVFAGANAGFIRELIVGHVADVRGGDPKYDTQYLQGVLSTRHVGISRVAAIAGQSLLEHIVERRDGSAVTNPPPPADAAAPPPADAAAETNLAANFALEESKRMMVDLGFLEELPRGRVRPAHSRHHLSMVWELRTNVQESICLGRLLPQILQEVEELQRLQLAQLPGVNAKQRTNLLVPVFFSLLLQLVDRTEHVPSGDAGALPPMHEHPYFSSSRRNLRDLMERWSGIFEADYNSYPPRLVHVRSPVPPGTPLDSALLQCVLDRSYILRQTAATQQALKRRLWHVGSILKTMHNTLWPCNEYFEVLAAVLRASFSHLRYLDTELMRAETDVPCVCDSGSEKRVYDDELSMPQKPAVAEPWCDARAEDRLRSDSSDADEAGWSSGDTSQEEDNDEKELEEVDMKSAIAAVVAKRPVGAGGQVEAMQDQLSAADD